MYITNKQLSELLVEGDYVGLESSDIIDWDDEVRNGFIYDYLSKCSKDGREEIQSEAICKMDLLKSYNNPAEFINQLHYNTYIYLANFLKEEIIDEMEALKDMEEDADKEFHGNVLELINYQLATMH